MSSELRPSRRKVSSLPGHGPGRARASGSGKVQRREPSTLGEALTAFLRQSGLSRGLATAEVFAAWDRSLGPGRAPRARPVAFEGGELRVEVDSAAHLHELQNFTAERHRIEANRLLGEERIRRVAIKLARRS